MNSEFKVFGGFLLGAIVGTAAGLLIAPDSGKKTRKMLRDKGEEFKDDLSSTLNESVENAKKNFNKKVDEYSKSGHKILEQLKDSVKTHN